MEREQILSVRGLSASFPSQAGRNRVRVVRDVSFDLQQGETLAIVGESGSGKSVTAKAIMGILGEGSVDGGSIIFSYHRKEEAVSEDLLQLSRKEMRRRINGKRIAMVFQDPMTSLNPTMPIGKQIMEGMRCHSKILARDAYDRAVRLLSMAGVSEPELRMKSYPHQLSGGMCQRVVIAAALSCGPDVLICDEPTTALDAMIQAKILDMIKEIQNQTGISVIFITHDLSVVAKVADKVAVMYAGRIIEKGTAEEIFFDPRHPYTWGLLSAIPDPDAPCDRLHAIPGAPPDPERQECGDAFAGRNAYALNIDYRLEPPMFRLTDTHCAATWLLHEKAPKVEMPAQLRERINRMKEEVNQHG